MRFLLYYLSIIPCFNRDQIPPFKYLNWVITLCLIGSFLILYVKMWKYSNRSRSLMYMKVQIFKFKFKDLQYFISKLPPLKDLMCLNIGMDSVNKSPLICTHMNRCFCGFLLLKGIIVITMFAELLYFSLVLFLWNMFSFNHYVILWLL